MHNSRAAWLRLAAVALCAASLAAGGCYQRTIRSKGIGSDSVTVEQPYQESNPVDDALFGPIDRRDSKPTDSAPRPVPR